MSTAIVACAAAKLTGRHPARHLYTSPNFAHMLRAAELGADRALILSARHGLVDPDQELDTYDTRLAAPGLDDKCWALASRIVDQAARLELTGDVYLLLPNAYARAARIGLHYHPGKFPGRNAHLATITVHDVFAGSRGIGDQRRAANDFVLAVSGLEARAV